MKNKLITLAIFLLAIIGCNTTTPGVGLEDVNTPPPTSGPGDDQADLGDDNEIIFAAAHMSINWLGSSIPSNARSIKIIVTPTHHDDKEVIGTVERPENTLILDVPVGKNKFTALAYDGPQATGVTVASAEVTATIVAGEENFVYITFPQVSEIDSVVLVLDPPHIRPGSTSEATAHAINEDGNTLDAVYFEWESSSPQIASITSAGIITGHAPGQAVISGIEPSTGISGRATIYVTTTSVVINRVSIGPGTGSIPVGGTIAFQARAFDVFDDEVFDVPFTFTSKNPSILDVDEKSGHATATGHGVAIIEVVADGISSQAEIDITRQSYAHGGITWELASAPTFPRVDHFDIAHDGTAYAYAQGKLWSNHGGGTAWYPNYTGDLRYRCGNNINWLLVVPSSSEEVLIGCGSKVIHTANAGASWSEIANYGIPQPAFHPVDSNIMLTDSSTLIFNRSNQTLESHSLNAEKRVVNKANTSHWVDYNPDTNHFSFEGDSVFMIETFNAGRTWTTIAPPQPSTTWEDCQDSTKSQRTERIGVSPSGDIYALVQEHCWNWPTDARYHYGLQMFDRMLDEWVEIYVEKTQRQSEALFRSRFLYFSPTEPDVIFALESSMTNILHSTDKGKTWSNYSIQSEARINRSKLSFSEHQPGLLSTETEFSLDYGKTWITFPIKVNLERHDGWYSYGSSSANAVQRIEPTPTGSVTITPVATKGLADRIGVGIVPSQEPHALYLHGTRSNRFSYRSIDYGETWVSTNTPSYIAAQSAANPRRWFFETSGSDIRVSEDNAQNYFLAGTLPHHGSSSYPEGNTSAIVTSYLDEDILYALTPGGVYRSNDGAKTWKWASTNLTTVSASTLVVDPTDHDTLYVGGSGVFKSTDGGEDWLPKRNGFFNSGVTSLAISSDGTTLFAGTYSGSVYRSIDAAETWEWVNDGFESYLVEDIVIDPVDENVIYTSTTGGVYKSTDKGSSWKLASDGIYTPFTTWLAISSDGESLYLGTEDHGIYRGSPSTALGHSLSETVRNHSHDLP